MRFFSFTWIFLLLVARTGVSNEYDRELQYGGDYGADSSTDYSSESGADYSSYSEEDKSSKYDISYGSPEEDQLSSTDDIPKKITPTKISFPSEKSIDKVLKTLFVFFLLHFLTRLNKKGKF